VEGHGLGAPGRSAVCHQLQEELGRPEWHADALCVEHPALIFVPSSGDPDNRTYIVCKNCLVRRECLTFALEHPDVTGCWGGTSTARRRTARTAGLTVDELLNQPRPR
jgi:WhiB family redox-sensing transcriptional regulator